MSAQPNVLDLVQDHFHLYDVAERFASRARTVAMAEFFDLIKIADSQPSAQAEDIACRIGDAVYAAALPVFRDALKAEIAKAKDGAE